MSRSKQIHFYLARTDALEIVDAIAKADQLSYTQTGLFDLRREVTTCDISELRGIGTAPTGNAVLEPAFLVLKPTQEVVIRMVPQDRGGTRYAVDQLDNPDSVVVRFGGDHQSAAIIGGNLGTCTRSPVSMKLYTILRRVFVQYTSNIRGVRVGKVAHARLLAGWRLTDDVRSPPEYDLRVE